MVRCWAFRSGVPFAVGVDEPAVVDRALRILRTGDWNPHVFDYPTLVIYFHAVVAGLVFLAGEAAGAWRAVADIDLAWVYAACRLAAAAVGVATVWIAYRLALDLGGRAAGIGAAALLAVFPMHVRESHFVLTDVPAAALVTLAIWLAVRAGDCPSLRRWAAAGAVAGLAAGAKYNGAVALVPVVLAGLVHEHDWRRRARAVTVATLAAAAAYVVAAPYTLLDATQFLAGFDAQMARFSGGRAPGAEAIWLVYLKHLALNGAGWLPAAAIGVVVLAARPESRPRRGATRLPRRVPATSSPLTRSYSAGTRCRSSRCSACAPPSALSVSWTSWPAACQSGLRPRERLRRRSCSPWP